MMPIRIQRKRTKGWRMPPNAVSVTRPGRWGNPFPANILGAALAKQMFRELMLGFFDPTPMAHLGDDEFNAICRAKEAWKKRLNWGAEVRHGAVSELRGKNLACFCPPDQPCHADVLLEIANPPPHRDGTP